MQDSSGKDESVLGEGTMFLSSNDVLDIKEPGLEDENYSPPFFFPSSTTMNESSSDCCRRGERCNSIGGKMLLYPMGGSPGGKGRCNPMRG
jgi:hypothetical protein